MQDIDIKSINEFEQSSFESVSSDENVIQDESTQPFNDFIFVKLFRNEGVYEVKLNIDELKEIEMRRKLKEFYELGG